MDFVWQPVTTSSVVRPRRSSRALPKGKLAPQKSMVTVWWPAAGPIDYSFLNSSKTITSKKYAQQIDEMDQKLQCLQPALVNRMGLILHDNTQLLAAQPMLQKWNKLGYKILPPLPYSPCYRDWAHSAYFRIRFERWGVEAKNLSLIQEDGTLTSQNNHLEESGWQVPLWIKDEGEVRK